MIALFNLTAALTLAFGAAFFVRVSIKKRRPMLLIFSVFTLFYMAFRPLLLIFDLYVDYAPLNPKLNEPSGTGLLFGIFFSLFSCIFFLFGYYCSKKKFKFDRIETFYKKKDLTSYVLIGLVISAAGLLLFIRPFYLLFLSTVIICFSSFKKYKLTNRFLFLIVFVLSYVLLFLTLNSFSDDRRDWLALVGIPAYLAVLAYRPTFLRYTFFGFLAFFAIVFISISLRSGVGGGFDPGAAYAKLSGNSKAILRIIELETDYSIVYDDYIQLFDRDVNQIPFLLGSTVIKPFVSFIPRTIFPEKPISISRLYSQKFNLEFFQNGGSQPITVFGELYWNFSYLSLVFFIGLGWLLGALDRSFLSNTDDALAFGFICSLSLTGFQFLRGPLDTFFLVSLWTFCIFLFLRIFARPMWRIKRGIY